MDKKKLVVICKNCLQEIDYIREPEKGMGYIECPKCKCSIDQEGTVYNKPEITQEMKKEIDKFSEEHLQLHKSFSLNNSGNYHEFKNYFDRHKKVVNALESMNIQHKSCEDFLDDYNKFCNQELISKDIDINECIKEIKSFKLNDIFMYLSKSGNIIINSTKEEVDNSSFLNMTVYKALRIIPRKYWGLLKFLSNNSNQDESIDKSLYGLGCLRVDDIDESNNMIKMLKGDTFNQAQLSLKDDKIELNRFFMVKQNIPYRVKEPKIISSDFIDKDFPVYVRKLVNSFNCQVHKDGTNIKIYSNIKEDDTDFGENVTQYFTEIVNNIKELSADKIVLDVTIERINENNDKITCHINDVLYCDKDIHNINFSKRKKLLDSLNIKKSSFEPVNEGYTLNKSPYIICKKREELEKAIERISKTKNYCGIVIHTDTQYSLKHQQPGIFVYGTNLSKSLVLKNHGQQDEMSMICNFLNCDVKDIFINSMRISGVEAGNMFNAIENITSKFSLIETRNFNGGEIPPIYQEIQLKKNLSKVYLVEGTRFYYSDINNIPFILQCYSVWGGYQLRFISHVNTQEFNIELKKNISSYAQENNFLKNEKFSISGEFLDDQTIEWEDLKLNADIKDKLKKLESLITKNDSKLDSRGLIFIGPPGCGKTLTGKLLSKMSPTFIWVTAKDCSNMGATSAFSTAFSLARDLRPTILFMEDIDSYLEYGMVDLLKTELDGMKLNNGIFTILTSNFPESLPEALIDRPGRFHDIIHFPLPDDNIRKEMVQYFLKEDIKADTIKSIVDQTKGYSGAHIREICRFAQIIQKEDNIDIDVALLKSLKKLVEQRKLIQDLRNKSKL